MKKKPSTTTTILLSFIKTTTTTNNYPPSSAPSSFLSFVFSQFIQSPFTTTTTTTNRGTIPTVQTKTKRISTYHYHNNNNSTNKNISTNSFLLLLSSSFQRMTNRVNMVTKYNPSVVNNNRSIHSQQQQQKQKQQQECSSSVLFPSLPRPSPRILFESIGDYRMEQSFEYNNHNNIQKPMYSQQSSLPQLPLPTLYETIETLIPTVLSTTTSTSSSNSNENEQEKIISFLKDCITFLTSTKPYEGQQLHQHLIQHVEKYHNTSTNTINNNNNDKQHSISSSSSSWLQKWWNQIIYLQYRESNVINASYFFQIINPSQEELKNNNNNYKHNGIISNDMNNKNNNNNNNNNIHTTTTQKGNCNNSNDYPVAIVHGAHALHVTALYAMKVLSGTHPVDTVPVPIQKQQQQQQKEQSQQKRLYESQPLCMTQYKMLFHACRIPQVQQDIYRVYDPYNYHHQHDQEQQSHQSHQSPQLQLQAAVVVNGQFYIIPLTTTTTKTEIIGNNNHHQNKEQVDQPQILSIETIQDLLQECVLMSRKNSNSHSNSCNSDTRTTSNDDTTPQQNHPVLVPEFGWLTSSHRDSWADVYQNVLQPIPELYGAIQHLESTMCLLCLDINNNDTNKNETQGMNWEHPRCFAKQLWHGNTIHSKNRYYDKSIQIIVNEKGNVGYIGEHTLVDGTVPMNLFHSIQHRIRTVVSNTSNSHYSQNSNNHSTTITNPNGTNSITGQSTSNGMSSSSSSSSSMTQHRPIPIFENAFRNTPVVVQNEIRNRIAVAQQDFLERITRLDLDFLSYKKYGRNHIKKWMYSPDAYVQVAMQLAANRLYYPVSTTTTTTSSQLLNDDPKYVAPLVPTYEATQTRKFVHGRTETIRSASLECQSFCTVMNQNQKKNLKQEQPTDEDRRVLLRKLLKSACTAHTQYTVRALDGYGVDRHLFGLRMILRELSLNNDKNKNEESSSSSGIEEDQIPDLFKNELYQRSQRWLMSTSTVPGCAAGFGHVDPDGIGIAYDILSDTIVFTVTCEKRTNYARQFTHYVHQALDDMYELHDNVDDQHQTNNIETSPPLSIQRSKL